MTKQELIDAIYQKSDLTNKAQIERTLNALGDVLADELYSINEVSLPGIGKLIPKQVKERIGRNPQNGDSVTIPARVKVMFKASKILKDAVNK